MDANDEAQDQALDLALVVVSAVVVIWLALSGATVPLLGAVVAFGAAHVILRD